MPATIDDALEILEGTGPEFGGGLSNHGPMAAEALLALGRDDVVVSWTENYKRRLRDHPQSRNPIDAASWREALGDGTRIGDWIAFFERQLAEAPWRDVLNIWVPRLAPGLIAAATHGVIRTGHAVRSVGAEETPARLHELAEGLGYWAARYRTLPEASRDATGARLPSEVLPSLETVPESGRRRVGLITEGLAQLDDLPSFAEATALVDSSGDASRFVSDLTETFAGVYLANAADTSRVITFIHSVTGPSALRLMAPYLNDDAVRVSLRYGWQAAAALYAAFGDTPSGPFEEPAGDAQDLIDRAVASGDEHAIKFTEACLREHVLNSRPVYLAAARHASGVLGGRS